MEIYFCGSISGGRKYLETYKKMVAEMKNLGHTVLSDHIVRDDVLDFEHTFSDQQIYERDVDWIKKADLIFAEVSNPSLGVGYEIATAEQFGKKILCLVHKDVFLTRMITGNSYQNLSIHRYEKDDDWQKTLHNFLK